MTAFSLIPKKFLILRFCLIHLKNSSTLPVFFVDIGNRLVFKFECYGQEEVMLAGISISIAALASAEVHRLTGRNPNTHRNPVRRAVHAGALPASPVIACAVTVQPCQGYPTPKHVIPAKAGIRQQSGKNHLDPRLRRDDDLRIGHLILCLYTKSRPPGYFIFCAYCPSAIRGKQLR